MRFHYWLTVCATTLLLLAFGPASAATYNYSAVTDICGAGGLTISVNVGDTVNIADTQSTCGTGSVTGMANRGVFNFIANGPDFIARVVTNAAGVGTGTVIWTGGNVFSITVVAIAPTAITSAATAVNVTGATLNGQVTSNGATTTASFDYGPTAAYGTNVAVPGTLTGVASGVAVSSVLTGLSCGTTYHFRVNGANSAGTTNGADESFTTSACTPTVTTTAATGINTLGATLNALVTANGSTTAVGFEYGTTVAYGTNILGTVGTPAAGGAVNAAVSVSLAALSCGTTYHFRATATNAGGTANGADLVFSTNACAPTPNPVPTSSEWSVVLLSLLMVGLAWRRF